MWKATIAGATILALASMAPGVQAQTNRGHVGPRVSYDFDADDLGIGAQFSLPIHSRLEFYPSFDVFFVDPGSLWQINADLKYRVSSVRSADWLYVGGGLGVRRVDTGSVSDAHALFNAFVGAESLRGAIHPFGEARVSLGDDSTFQLAGGINITLGHRH